MAFSPNIQLCLKSGCTSLIFKETTGIYNATTNPTGYGSPNPVKGDFISAILTVIAPDSTEYTIDLFTEGFPENDDTIEYEIPLSDLGNRSSIEDGYWVFTYTIDTGSTVYNVTKSYFFYCNAECCVARLLSTIDIFADPNNQSNKRKLDNYKFVRTLLDSLKGAANCANETQFNLIKSLITKLCRNTDCKTCK